MRSRGYTLIEIAGVMVVLGLLLGASLWPLDRQLREFEYRQERANMERLRDTVLGYALRHRTPGVDVTIFDEDTGPQTGFYAKGRPYLPCPDRTGDGISDRTDLINPVMQTLSVSFARPTPRYRVDFDNNVRLEDRRGFAGRAPFEESRAPFLFSGVCHANKGQLPWRTLGSIPADYWGNRYTYFADPAFATEATGFDEKTIADSGERRLPQVFDLTLGYIPLKRERFDIMAGAVADSRPSVICPVIAVIAVAAAGRGDIVCGLNGTIDAPATLIAGEPAPTDGNGFLSGLSDLSRGILPDIADGLPFVIVSHGHNGFGAFNHLVLRQDPDERQGAICRWLGGLSAGESVNAYIFSAIAFDPNTGDLIDDECSVARHSPFGFLFNQQKEEGYFFAHRSDVSAARAASSLSDQTGLDDLLVWMTRGDLARRMREADVFPLIENDSDRPPVFYEPL